MTFFDPPMDYEKHECRPPEIYHGTPRGYRCRCGKAFVKESVSQHGESWWQWKRAPEFDCCGGGAR